MARFDDFYTAGNVPEKVINRLWEISPKENPFTTRIQQGSKRSAKHEFLEHALATPNKDNAAIDGAAQTDDSTSQAVRKWDWCQLTERGIQLGSQAEASDGFGGITSFARQLESRTAETRNDREACHLSENGSREGDGLNASRSAGFFAWVETNTNFGATGADGGFDSGTGRVASPTAGTARALSEGDISGVHQSAFKAGGNIDCFMMIPELKTRWTNFMFSSSSRIGAIYTPTKAGEGGATAIGSIQMYESNWGAVEVMANRIMQAEAANRTNFALIDSRMWENSEQFGVRAERLAKDGHGETWMVESSWTLLALNEASSGAVRDIDYTQDMTQ